MHRIGKCRELGLERRIQPVFNRDEYSPRLIQSHFIRDKVNESGSPGLHDKIDEAF